MFSIVNVHANLLVDVSGRCTLILDPYAYAQNQNFANFEVETTDGDQIKGTYSGNQER